MQVVENNHIQSFLRLNLSLNLENLLRNRLLATIGFLVFSLFYTTTTLANATETQLYIAPGTTITNDTAMYVATKHELKATTFVTATMVFVGQNEWHSNAIVYTKLPQKQPLHKKVSTPVTTKNVEKNSAFSYFQNSRKSSNAVLNNNNKLMSITVSNSFQLKKNIISIGQLFIKSNGYFNSKTILAIGYLPPFIKKATDCLFYGLSPPFA